MKILFVFLNNEFRTFVPPNLSSLEGYIKKGGHQTKVFDTSFYPEVVNIENMERNINAGAYKGVNYKDIGVPIKEKAAVSDFLKQVEDFMPDVVGVSLYGYTSHIAELLCKNLKDKFPNIIIIYGGIEVTLHSKAYLEKEYVDLICAGEGEKSLLEVCDRVESKIFDFTNIPNIWTKNLDTGEIKEGPLGEFINLDDLNVTDWDSYESYHQYSPYNGILQKMAMVEFSRGCPYSCTYCESSTLKFMHADQGINKYVRN